MTEPVKQYMIQATLPFPEGVSQSQIGSRLRDIVGIGISLTTLSNMMDLFQGAHMLAEYLKERLPHGFAPERTTVSSQKDGLRVTVYAERFAPGEGQEVNTSNEEPHITPRTSMTPEGHKGAHDAAACCHDH